MSNNENQKPVDTLNELICFAERKLSDYHFELSKHQTRKGLVFQYMGAAHGLMRPILNLLQDERSQTHAATILVRTLFEINVRLIYLFCSKGHQNVIKGFRESFRKKISSTKEWEMFITNNQQFADTLDIKLLTAEIPNWTKFQVRIEKIFTKRYGHENYNWPRTLKDMVREIDNWNSQLKPNRRNKNDLMWSYLTIYGYWSQIVHLDLDGLNRYMNKTTGGYELMIHGDPDDVDRLAITAFLHYLHILDIFSLQFGIPTREELKPLKEKMKLFTKIN